MKIVANCPDLVSLSYQGQVKVCNPIPLTLTQETNNTTYITELSPKHGVTTCFKLLLIAHYIFRSFYENNT